MDQKPSLFGGGGLGCKLMSEAMLGPDVSITIAGNPEVRSRVLSLVATESGDLNEEIDTLLMSTIRKCLEQVLSKLDYIHDGYSLAWELTDAYEFNEDLLVSTSFNIHVKSDDFDFFDGALNNDTILGYFLTEIQQTLVDYLTTRGIGSNQYKTTTTSDGFGYG